MGSNPTLSAIIGPDGGALNYALNTAELAQGIVTSRVTWGEPIEGKARDILADAEQTDSEHDEESALEEAMGCLREIMANGQRHEAIEVTKEARGAGHAERTVRRAREALRVKPGGTAAPADGTGAYRSKMATSPQHKTMAILATLRQMAI